MSSPEQQLPASGSSRPPTPGLHLTRWTSPSYKPYSHANDEDSPSRLASLDLTSTRNTHDAYDTCIELQQLPTSNQDESDSHKLLEPRARRSSTASSISSSSTIVRQGRAVQWLNSIGDAVEAFGRLAVIRHILWPFQWLDRSIARLMRRTRFQGWRMGIILGSCMSSIVLGVNIAILVIGGTRNGGYKDGFAVPMSGVADEMSRWSSAIHIVINALSTLLLAASNYTMQVVSSPTRKDIDKAHAKHEYLDVGVLSLRNLGRIPRRRLLIFIIMGFSSVPIHLFYNSAVFYIGANNEYDMYILQKDSEQWYEIYDSSNAVKNVPKGGILYDMIDESDWARTYDTPLVSYGDLYLTVIEYRSEIENKTLDGYPQDWPNVATETADAWSRGDVTWGLNQRCVKPLGTQEFIKNVTATASVSRSWIRLGSALSQTNCSEIADVPKFARVVHGFARRVDTASRIQLSLTFLTIVIVCNSVKLLTMLWVVFMGREDHIVTLGDGASSFLERPDPTTERMCILSKQEIIQEVADAPYRFKYDDALSRLVTQTGKGWVKQFSTYSNALNRDREVGSYFIFMVVGVLFGLFLCTVTFFGKASTAWGTSSDTTFREADSSGPSTLLNAWIANAAQLILSFCYLAINSECTAMAGAAEWNSLASSRKGLRVTRPVGQQRDTYFLQLPYRWSLPLTITSGGLHWLLSQSIFLVRIDTYDRAGNIIPGDRSKSACGFSGVSFIIMTCCFWVLVGTVGLIGRKKIKVMIPFAASCSLVISAACHPPEDDRDARLKPVQWGVVEGYMYDREKHCSLTSRRVGRPKAGEKYF